MSEEVFDESPKQDKVRLTNLVGDLNAQLNRLLLEIYQSGDPAECRAVYRLLAYRRWEFVQLQRRMLEEQSHREKSGKGTEKPTFSFPRSRRNAGNSGTSSSGNNRVSSGGKLRADAPSYNVDPNGSSALMWSFMPWQAVLSYGSQPVYAVSSTGVVAPVVSVSQSTIQTNTKDSIEGNATLEKSPATVLTPETNNINEKLSMSPVVDVVSVSTSPVITAEKPPLHKPSIEPSMSFAAALTRSVSSVPVVTPPVAVIPTPAPVAVPITSLPPADRSPRRRSSLQRNGKTSTTTALFLEEPPSPVEPWDEGKVCQELFIAQEPLWREFEEWVDLQAAEEDEEWRQLEFGINKYIGLLTEDSLHLTSSDAVPFGLGEADNSSDPSTLMASFSNESTSPALVTTPKSGSAPTFESSLTLMSIGEESKSNGRYGSNVMTPASISSPPSLSSRLHAKLSSPDRKRTIPPEEARKRIEQRIKTAIANRDKSVAERVQRAGLVSTRVQELRQRVVERKAQAEEALQDRLKSAERRHSEHLDSIRGRAKGHSGSSSASIASVTHSLNSAQMNSESLARTLQARLEETEMLILAATMKREIQLTGVSSLGKRQKKKVEQMSEFRLELERKKMERWEQLQRRFEAVQEMRRLRLAEIKRLEDVAAAEAEEEEEEINAASAVSHALISANSPAAISISSPPLSALTPRTGVLSTLDESFVEPEMLVDEISALSNLDLGFNEVAELARCYVPIVMPTELSVSVYKSLVDSLTPAKKRSARNKAWLSSLRCLEHSRSVFNSLDMSTLMTETPNDDTPLRSMVCKLDQIQQTRSLSEDREASSYNLYASILREMVTSGNTPHVSESVNFLIFNTLDPTQDSQSDRLGVVSRSGGVLLLSALLSGELGALHSCEDIRMFVESYKRGTLELVSDRRSVDYMNLLVLLERLVTEDNADLWGLFGCGVHLVLSDLLLMLSTARNVLRQLENGKLEVTSCLFSSDAVRLLNFSLGDWQARVVSILNHLLSSSLKAISVAKHQSVEESNPAISLLASTLQEFQLYAYFCDYLTPLVEQLHRVSTELQSSTTEYTVYVAQRTPVLSASASCETIVQSLTAFVEATEDGKLTYITATADYARQLTRYIVLSRAGIFSDLATAKHLWSRIRRAQLLESLLQSFICGTQLVSLWCGCAPSNSLDTLQDDDSDDAQDQLASLKLAVLNWQVVFDQLLSATINSAEAIWDLLVPDMELYVSLASGLWQSFAAAVHLFMVAAVAQLDITRDESQSKSSPRNSLIAQFLSIGLLSRSWLATTQDRVTNTVDVLARLLCRVASRDFTIRKQLGEKAEHQAIRQSLLGHTSWYAPQFNDLCNSPSHRTILDTVSHLSLRFYKSSATKFSITMLLAVLCFELEQRQTIVRQAKKDKFVTKVLNSLAYDRSLFPAEALEMTPTVIADIFYPEECDSESSKSRYYRLISTQVLVDASSWDTIRIGWTD